MAIPDVRDDIEV